MKKRIAISFLLLLIRMVGHAQLSPAVELRGVWIATVYNIDWPSSSDLNAKEQKKQIVELLDFYKKLNINSVFVQVRPSADTFYPSKLEPWSRYLTGEQGRKPKPYYDPLKFWIKEAHKRGMEFHAWINPFRITNSSKEKLSEDHPALKHPDWVLTYNGKMLYNPAVRECRTHITNVVREIVRNYDVDGIHFDDYFYPYPKAGESLNDSVLYQKTSMGFESIADWRRNNVNQVVKEVHDAIKAINPHVKFGVSPFGVWRNKSMDDRGSDTKAGITNFDDLYADVLLWLEKDWIDYVTPQLYWSVNNVHVPFEHLCEWWAAHSYGKDVYVGLAAYKLDSTKEDWNSASKLTNQIDITRAKNKINGIIFYSHNHLKSNRLEVADTLSNYFHYPSLVPPVTTGKEFVPAVPFNIKWQKNQLKWKCKGSKGYGNPSFYAIYIILRGGEQQLVYLSGKKKIDASVLPVDLDEVFGFQVSSIGKYNHESLTSDILYK